MEILAYCLGIIIGLILGLLGSGGSILTIPVLVYLLDITPSLAATYSLFIVGIAALVGTLKNFKDSYIDRNVIIYFGIPSILSIMLMRYFIMPVIPHVLYISPNISLEKDDILMLLFALVMISASLSMIKNNKTRQESIKKFNHKKLIALGLSIGLLTGLLGVGGGFLIIPTLVIYGGLSMQHAVANSLVLISCNALIGFGVSLSNTPIDWNFLLCFTALSIMGILLGITINKKISNANLKPMFGWFVLAIGIYILIKELFY